MTLDELKEAKLRDISYHYEKIRKTGQPILNGIVQELTLDAMLMLQIQYDVKSLDPAYDANGYIISDTSGNIHSGISKADYQQAQFTHKLLGMQLWIEWKTLQSSVSSCTTEAELNALQFDPKWG